MLRGRGSLGAALWGLRHGPGVLGLTVEDRLRLGALESPVAVCDLSLKLTRCPAGVADEDPQTVHGLVTAELVEDRLRLGALESPVAVCDLGLKLTRCPAGVADEDPQTVHGLVTAEQM